MSGLTIVRKGTPLKINLGSGKFPLEGYVNVDIHEPAELEFDVWELGLHDVEEVRMSHFLEHFSWRETRPLLQHVRSWMKRGGLLVVEVPNMERIMAHGTRGDWLRYVYGSQQHEGEYHRTGFSFESLPSALLSAGFRVRGVKMFPSQHPSRRGMPCLEAWGTA